jgi:hypothetical protein
VGDLSGRRHALDTREPDPFDVPDDGEAHAESLPVLPAKQDSAEAESCGLIPAFGGADP